MTLKTHFCLGAALAVLAAFGSQLRAQTTLQWDAGNTTTIPVGGNGTWSTTLPAEWLDPNTNTVVQWHNSTSDTAEFGLPTDTTATSITLSGTVNAAGLFFNNGIAASGNASASYTINGSSSTATINSAAGTFKIADPNTFFTGISLGTIAFKGATTYQFTGGTNNSLRPGENLSGAVTFDNNVLLGTGSDFGTLSYSNGANITDSSHAITVSNDWSILDRSGTSTITQNLVLNGLGNAAQGALGFGPANNDIWQGNITLASDSAIAGRTNLTSTMNSNISGSGNLYLTYNIYGTPTTSTGLIITGTNTYTGQTIIMNSTNLGDATSANGGITAAAVKLGETNALPTGTTVVLGVTPTVATVTGAGTIATTNSVINNVNGNYAASDGALDLNGFNQTVAGLAVGGSQTAGNQYIGNNSGSATSTLTIAGSTTPTAGFGGIIEDNFAQQTGANVNSVTGRTGGKVAFAVTSGAIKLTGANTYTGGTSVSGGTLTAGVASTGSSSAFGAPSSALAVSGTGTLALNGFSQTFGAMTLSGSGIVSFGATGTTLSATSLNWAGGSSDFALNLGAAYVTTSALTVGSLTESGTPHSYTFNFTGGTVGTTYDIMNLTSLGAAAATDFTSTGEAGTFTFSGNQLQFTLGATPEPSTWALLLGGAALLGFVIRRRSFNS